MEPNQNPEALIERANWLFLALTRETNPIAQRRLIDKYEGVLDRLRSLSGSGQPKE
jgi:hypothetical protein